jgi:PST family polysaccharide transporter
MPDKNKANIKQKALSASKWGVLVLVLPKIITPLITIVLAHFLTPEDYGIVAIAALIVGLASIFQGMAISQTLIQTQENITKTANSCFWLSIIFGSLLSIAIFFSAESFSVFFHDQRVTDVLRVQCWMVLFSSLASVPEALLKRKFLHSKLLGVTMAPIVALFLIAVPMAAYGFGYWALVIAALVGALVRAILVWSKVEWRPTLSQDSEVTKSVLKFGGLVAVEGICGWALNHGDNAVLGHFLDSRDLGLYVFAYSIVMLIGMVFSSPVSSVSYPLLCRVQKDNNELIATYKKGVQLIGGVIFPAFLGLSMVAHLVVPAIFGNRWEGLAPVVSILCIHPGLSYVLSLNSEVYKAKGRPDITAKFQLISMLYLIPVYLISVRFGLIGFCFGRFSMILSWIPHVIVISKVLDIKPSFMWECIRFPLIASLLMCLVILPINWLTIQNVDTLLLLRVRLALSIIVAVATYSGIYYFFNKDFLTHGYRLMMRSIRA